MARHVYTAEDRALGLAALVACGGVWRDAARKSGYPATTLRRWAESDPSYGGTIGAQKKDDLASRFEDIANRATGLQALAMRYIEGEPDERERGKLALAHMSDLNRVGGTAVDKMRLLRGQSTEISDVGFYFDGGPEPVGDLVDDNHDDEFDDGETNP